MILVPGFEYVDLGPDGGPYDERAHPKVCWHTTEGLSLAGAEAAFRPYPPHLGYDPRTRQRRQYVSLDRHSYSLRGDENDDEYVVQVELVGYAAQAPGWPAEYYRNIGVDVLAPLRSLLGVPDTHLRFYAPGDVSFALATPTSPIRLTAASFRAFSGHLGHQHVPSPDAHWDPGGFRFDDAVAASYSKEDTVGYTAYGYPIPPHAPDDPDDYAEVVVPLPPQGGATGAAQVWVTLSNTNADLYLRVAHWQCRDGSGSRRVVDQFGGPVVLSPRDTTGGMLAPVDAHSLVLDYRSPYGAGAAIEVLS